MTSSRFSVHRLRAWPVRALLTTGLLAVGLLWAAQLDFGVTEIRRANSGQNFPLAMAPATADDWPGVYGLQHAGICPRDGFPRTIGLSSRGSWQAEVPGVPCGSPCARGDIVVIPVVDPARAALALWAWDCNDGQPRWKTVMHHGVPMNPARVQGAATPACDGQAVFLGAAVDGRLLVSSVDLQGRQRWMTDAGPMHCENGRLVSPLLHDELVIVSAEHGGVRNAHWLPSSHLTAVHRQTGEIIWRIRRPNREHQITPALADVCGRMQLILAASGEIAAYDPSNGDLVWSCRWEATQVAESVAWDERHIFAAASAPKPLVLAIRADGTGDVSSSHVVWRSQEAAVSAIAPVRAADSVVLLNEDGLLTSLDRGTGKLQWKRQLTGHFNAAPLRAGSELLCLNVQGAASVVDLDRRGKAAAELAVGIGSIAHPAATRRQFIQRTRTGLLCLPWDGTEPPVVHAPDWPTKRL